jgi:hypothetical protein
MEPSKDWKEIVAEDEKERFERHAQTLAGLQKERSQKHPMGRALHAKQHAGLTAELEVLAGVPEHLRIAVFGEPKKHAAYVRFSNGSGARVSDDKPDLRGLAIKVMGVPGKKLIPGMENETTQDFLFINTEALAFRTVDDFVHFMQASTSQALLPFRLFARYGFGTFAFLKKLLAAAHPVTSLATETYSTVAPIKYGDYAARLSLAPKQTDAPAALVGSLREELEGRIKKNALVWDLRAQLFVSEDKTPIENPSIPWLEADSPYLTLGRLTIPAQDPASDDGKKTSELVEKMAFDPWHAAEELRPLGAAMRARSPAYRESQKMREAAKEPTS